MNQATEHPDPLDALLDAAAAHCKGDAGRLRALASALEISPWEAGRYLYARRSRPNGTKALALYEHLAKKLRQETWLPWRKI